MKLLNVYFGKHYIVCFTSDFLNAHSVTKVLCMNFLVSGRKTNKCKSSALYLCLGVNKTPKMDFDLPYAPGVCRFLPLLYPGGSRVPLRQSSDQDKANGPFNFLQEGKQSSTVIPHKLSAFNSILWQHVAWNSGNRSRELQEHHSSHCITSDSQPLWQTHVL